MANKKSSELSGSVGGVTSPKGFRAAGGVCGIKVSGKPDLALIVADRPCAAAAVYTTNQMPSAPVIVGKRHLKSGIAQAVICNSGNANASTGEQGERDAIDMCRHVAAAIGCKPNHVVPSSTGVIGRPLPMEKIAKGITALSSALAVGEKADADAARAIMTTDLVPKTTHRSFKLGGKTVQLAGIAKGSGMIAPNMATMLAFLTTDADVAPAMLKKALQLATAASFNRMSVDQHTSPSDTVMVLASGAAGNKKVTTTGKDFDAFLAALTEVAFELAYKIVKDGEGATRVFRVNVINARSEKDADKIAKEIVNSPLVKAAVHGGDPNWGRITTAAGYAGVKLDPSRMSLTIAAPGDKKSAIKVYAKGQPTKLTPEQSKLLNANMKNTEVVFTLDMGAGKHSVQWLGCDLSKEYVSINADYTT